MRLSWCLAVALLLGGWMLPSAGADEPDRAAVQAKVEAMKKEVAELIKAGKEDEAKQLYEKTQAIIREHLGERRDAPAREGGGPNREALMREGAALKRRLAELKEAGKLDEAERVEKELQKLAATFKATEEKRDTQREGRETPNRERPAGDRPRAEGERRDGDRPRAEGERRDGDKPRTEGERREGDRPRGDAPRRDGDRPRSEGDQPRREGGDQPRREGDQPRREGGDQPRREGAERRPLNPELHKRAQHMLEAAEHLQAAGLNDMAEHLRHQARMIQEHRGEGPREAPPRREIPAEMREMHEQLQLMRRELEEVRQQLRRAVERKD